MKTNLSSAARPRSAMWSMEPSVVISYAPAIPEMPMMPRLYVGALFLSDGAGNRGYLASAVVWVLRTGNLEVLRGA